MASTLVLLLVRHVLRLVRLAPKPDDKDKDVEIAVLRHQLGGAAPPVCPPTLQPHRSPDPGQVVQNFVTGALVGVPCHAGYAVALASGTRTASMDLPSKAVNWIFQGPTGAFRV